MRFLLNDINKCLDKCWAKWAELFSRVNVVNLLFVFSNDKHIHTERYRGECAGGTQADSKAII